MRSQPRPPRSRVAAVAFGAVVAFGALLALAPAPVRADALEGDAAPVVGPFALESKDGKSRIQLGLALQLKLEIDAQDPGPGIPTELSHFVEATRIRPMISGTLFTRDLSFFLQFSTAPGAIEILDAFLDYRFEDWVQLRVGQFKIPFTRYRLRDFWNLTFVDWALPVTAFGAERQMGAAIHNGYVGRGRLEYELGVFTGMNACAQYGTGVADLYGEKVPNPSDFVSPASRASFHPELVLHASYNQGGIETNSDTDFEGGPPRFSAGASVAWDLSPVETQDFSLRLAPEVLAKAYGFSLAGVLYVGYAPTGSALADQSFAMIGGLIQGSALVHPQIELTLRYGVVATQESFRDRARQRADGLIAAATDSATQAAQRSQYGEAGLISREEEATVGFNVYLVGRAVKWQSDLSWLGRSLAEGRRNGARFRTMIQLVF
jgi:hypothetical protein